MNRRKVVFMMLGGAGAVAARGFAHEGHQHVRGTVKAVQGDRGQVEVTTEDGKAAVFYVDAQTKYLKGTAAASLADVTPGTRVVADVKTAGGRTLAVEVRIGTGAPTSK